MQVWVPGLLPVRVEEGGGRPGENVVVSFLRLQHL
jgi:hypothetical protein